MFSIQSILCNWRLYEIYFCVIFFFFFFFGGNSWLFKDFLISSIDQHIFETEIFVIFDIIITLYMLIVTFDQFQASLLNKSIKF